MPDLIPDEYGIFDRHPVRTWIPVEDPVFIGAFAGMTENGDPRLFASSSLLNDNKI
jgi:hypothetical protein